MSASSPRRDTARARAEQHARARAVALSPSSRRASRASAPVVADVLEVFACALSCASVLEVFACAAWFIPHTPAAARRARAQTGRRGRARRARWASSIHRVEHEHTGIVPRALGHVYAFARAHADRDVAVKVCTSPSLAVAAPRARRSARALLRARRLVALGARATHNHHCAPPPPRPRAQISFLQIYRETISLHVVYSSRGSTCSSRGNARCHIGDAVVHHVEEHYADAYITRRRGRVGTDDETRRRDPPR